MMTSIPQREINPIILLRCANNQNIDYHYFGVIYLCCGDNDNCHLISAISNVLLIVIKGKIIVPSFSYIISDCGLQLKHFPSVKWH